MAIDLYSLDDVNRSKLLFQLHENDLSLLEDVFYAFQKKTGVYIDPYKDTRIYQDHVELILDLLSKQIDQSKNKNGRLVQIKDNFSLSTNGLIVVGDW